MEWQTLRVVPDDALSITVYNLTPVTRYQFMVLSRSHLGDEHFSKQVSVVTQIRSKTEFIIHTYIHTYINLFIQKTTAECKVRQQALSVQYYAK